jgi:hypothetical protein
MCRCVLVIQEGSHLVGYAGRHAVDTSHCGICHPSGGSRSCHYDRSAPIPTPDRRCRPAYRRRGRIPDRSLAYRGRSPRSWGATSIRNDRASPSWTSLIQCLVTIGCPPLRKICDRSRSPCSRQRPRGHTTMKLAPTIEHDVRALAGLSPAVPGATR